MPPNLAQISPAGGEKSTQYAYTVNTFSWLLLSFAAEFSSSGPIRKSPITFPATPSSSLYISFVCRIAEGVEQDQKAAAKVEKERELRRRLREEDREMEKKAKEAEDIMLGRRTKELINIKLYDKKYVKYFLCL